jgi:hypothetical protein
MSNWTPISGSVPQYQAADGTLASGYYLKFYSAGTTSPLSMATDSTGGTTLAKAQINTAGYPVNGSGDVFIPHVSQSYKIVLYKNATDADNDTTANADWVIDNISQSAAATPTQVVNIEHQLGSEASGQVFTLTSFTYSLGTNNLLVYRNGQLLRQGVSFDYSETTASTITVNSAITIEAGDTWAFVKGTSTTSTISDAASVTYTPAGSGAVATNVQAKLREVVSVIDWGADPTGVADSTAAIQAAMDNSEASYSPPGVYRIDGTLVVPDMHSHYGVSSGGLFLNTTTTTKGTLYIKDASSTAGPILRFTTSGSVSGIMFRHRKANGGTEGIVSFGETSPSQACVYNSLSDCSIFGEVTEDLTETTTCFGIYGYDGSVAYPNYWNRINNVQITNVDVGVKLNAQCNANHFANVIVKEAVCGFWLDGGASECIDNIFTGVGAYNGTSYSPAPPVIKMDATCKFNVFTISSEFFGKSFEMASTAISNTFIGQFNEITPSDPGDDNQLISAAKNLITGATEFRKDIATAGNADQVIKIERLTSDGELIDFRKDDANVGSIVSKDGDLCIGVTDVGVRFNDANNNITPHNVSTNAGSDNLIDLGSSGARFKEIYAGTGTINTSDRNEKEDISLLEYKEVMAAKDCKALIRKYRFRDNNENIHFGVIAQDVVKVFENHGLDPFRYSIVKKDILDNGYTRYGVRYNELLCFIIAGL